MEKSLILFVCTGNYYRSRFAEILFNYLAAKSGNKKAFAFSRGLEVYKSNNPGPISGHTRKRLQTLSIPLGGPVDFPVQIQVTDFDRATTTIVLDEEEHRPMMQKYFPEWEDKVVYWKVHDLDKTSPDEALAAIEKLVRDFFREEFLKEH